MVNRDQAIQASLIAQMRKHPDQTLVGCRGIRAHRGACINAGISGTGRDGQGLIPKRPPDTGEAACNIAIISKVAVERKKSLFYACIPLM